MTDHQALRDEVLRLQGLCFGGALLGILRHTLGHDGERNYYRAEVNCEDWRNLWVLVGLGLMRADATINENGDMYFCATPAGVRFWHESGGNHDAR